MKRWALIAILALVLVGCNEEGNNDSPTNKPAVDVAPQPVFVVFGDEVVKNAKKYLHVNETAGPNRSPEIDKFHDYSGLPYGNPWCLMYVTYNWKEVLEPYGLEPYTRTARVSRLLQHSLKHKYQYKVMFAKGIIYGVNELKPGDMAIWIKGVNKLPEDNFNGHVGFVTSQVDNDTVKTIEGNTGPGAAGSQRDGDGVYERTRDVRLGADFRIEAFIRPIYPETEKK